MIADRGNQRVADRFDNLSPAVLRVLRQIAQAAERHATPLTLCGEMAGRPLEAMALIGLGFRSISVAPASVGPIKAMVLSLDAGQLAERLDALLAGGETSLREDLKRFAAENGVQA
jgi:phosphotransferase system enzyme I (PtsP)